MSYTEENMSDTAMKYEDWLRWCVHHDGRKGNVYLPWDMVLAIADWIEAHRYDEPVVLYKDGECPLEKGKTMRLIDVDALLKNYDIQVLR